MIISCVFVWLILSKYEKFTKNKYIKFKKYFMNLIHIQNINSHNLYKCSKIYEIEWSGWSAGVKFEFMMRFMPMIGLGLERQEIQNFFCE